MGWGRGSEVMEGLIDLAKQYVQEDVRSQFYKGSIQLLENMDWDCVQDCLGQDPMWDDAMYDLYPGWRECSYCGDCFEDHDDEACGTNHLPQRKI